MSDKRDQTPHGQPDGRFVKLDRDVTRRQFVGLSASAFVAAVLAACGGEAPAPTTAPVGQATTAAPARATAAVTPAAGAAPTVAAPAGKKGGAFHGAWPYQVPPEGHFNSLAGVQKSILGGGSGAGSIYRDILEMPLGMYLWQDKKWLPMLATEWKVDGENFRIKLREGAKWSDGKPLSSKDVVTTFWCLRIMRQPVWNFIDDVKADGDLGVVFHMSNPSTVVERYVMRENIKSDATFGEWGKKVQDLYAAGKKVDDDEGKKLNQEIQQFRPKEMITTGPYKIDANSITNAQLTLVKNPNSWTADKVAFDKVVLFNGETPDITPVVLAKDVDYATHGFPPATEQAFKQANIRIARPPTFSGGAILFNFDKLGAFFGDKRARQAVAMVIDRAQNSTVTYGESAKAPKYMAGIPDALVEQWLSKDDAAKLNTYQYDPKKAEQVLTELGWKKGGDGVWQNKEGARAEFELLSAAEFADHSASAQNAAEQLTKFGIKTTLRTVTFTQVDPDVWKGNFQMAIRTWGNASHPHPQFSYDNAFFQWNTRAANQGGKGMAFDLKQQTESVGEVDLQKLTIDSAQGLDETKQKANVTKIARAYNELLPVIPLYERFGNNPVLENVRVTGWPKDDDPLLKNSAYADNFAVISLLEAKLRPV